MGRVRKRILAAVLAVGVLGVLQEVPAAAAAPSYTKPHPALV